MADDIILETHNLRREFGALVAVDDVSIQVRAGTLHSIIGPNGAGKTTFFNLLSGNLSPTSGQVYLQRRGHNQPAGPQDSASGNRSFLPDHQYLPQPDRLRECSAGGPGAGIGQLPHVPIVPALSALHRSDVASPGAGWPSRSGGDCRPDTAPRRPAQTGAGHDPGPGPGAAAAG